MEYVLLLPYGLRLWRLILYRVVRSLDVLLGLSMIVKIRNAILRVLLKLSRVAKPNRSRDDLIELLLV